MKIAFCYPPFSKNGRFANLPQNRQFIYTASSEVRIFPIVMAQACTWAKNSGHDVLWLDGITQRLTPDSFEKVLFDFKPDLIVLETKAPIMNKVWKQINKWKMVNDKWKIVLVGDHVTFFPEESFKNSKVDFVLTGGDYDFLLKSLVLNIEEGSGLEPGIWFREDEKLKMKDEKYVSKIKNTGAFKLNHDLDQVPVIDRGLTRWKDYGEAYLYHPCAYVMFGRGCGISDKNIGACTFCIWQQAFWKYTSRLVSPEKAVLEVKNLVSLGVKEIFDDTESGVLKDFNWLLEFYQLLKKEKLLGRIVFSSNARADQLDKEKCMLLKKIGYRLLKIGLESGSDKTLEKISKKEKIEQIVKGVKNAKDAGLRVMLTIMVGYPWENEEDVIKTFEAAKKLVMYKTRAGDCLQASIVTPYPGTTFWQLAIKNGWLKIKPDKLEKYDMEGSILKTKIDPDYWCKKIWSIQKDYQFIFRSAITIRNFKELFLLLRGAKSLFGHIKDYAKIDKQVKAS